LRFNRLGNTGLFVSELCLGTMNFGGAGEPWRAFGALSQEEADRQIRTAIEAGINFLDTADAYAEGAAEEMVGRALRTLAVPRDEIVVATKVFGPTGTGPNNRGASRGHIMDALKGSLKRLQVDHIDLYQIHGFDRSTPVEETVRALDSLVQQGHVRYVGVSNWAAWQLMKAAGIAERHGLARIESLQAYYTIASRDLEREIVPMLESEKMGLLVWSPLAGGLLSGKYERGHEKGGGGRRGDLDFPPVDRERASAAIAAMRRMAAERNVSVAQIAIAWLLHQPVVSSVIIGAKRQDQLADNIAAANVILTSEELRALDEISRLPAEYPGWMFEFLGQYRPELPHRVPRGGSAPTAT
jgi:aryl-alcohol dehydrogenase-like predicted oxidoreductase